MDHCKRIDGALRAWFNTRQEAESFATDPENVGYHGDVVTFCARCGFFHLSNESWLPDLPWEIPAKNLRRN